MRLRHRLRRPRGAAGLAGLALVVAAGCAVDLGTLGGTGAHANDVNASEVTVGWSLTAGGDQRHAFRKLPGRPMEDLNGRYLWSEATAVNDAGVVVGYAGTSAGDSRAVLWDLRGRPHDLGAGPESSASDINEDGTIVGSAGADAFVRDARTGAVETLPRPDAEVPPLSTSAWAINDEGAIVGRTVLYPDTQAVLWAAGTHEVTLLDQPVPSGPIGGRQASGAQDIDNGGTIVGYSSSSAIPVLWTADTHEAVDITPPGTEHGSASAINDRGQVVGTDFERAIRWVPGEAAVDLGGLGGTAEARAVNDRGVAAGVAYTPDGNPHAVVFRTR